MNAANRRAALASLDAARPAAARLDPGRHPDENAADIIEIWTALETALRSMIGGSVLSGQPLIRELRQREMISLDQGHALLEALAARDRVQRTDYQPVAADLAAVREGFESLDRTVSAPIPEGQDTAVPAAGATPGAAPAPAPAGSGGAAPGASPLPPLLPPAVRRSTLPWGAVAAVLVIVAVAVGGWYYVSHRSGIPSDVAKAVGEYAGGSIEAARADFQSAARNHPELAMPHIYLSRIARDQGDLATAGAEVATAVKLEPQNAVALRELGAFFLTRGTRFTSQGRPDLAAQDYEGSRRAYVRSLQIDPSDTSAQGYLGCVLTRLGRGQEAQGFLTRAGQGPWSACANAPQGPAGAGITRPGP